MAKSPPDANRLTNPAFAEAAAEGLPKGWWTWQDEGSRGRFSRDAEAACLTAMANGCFGQNVPVQPGETYAVRVRVRTEGRSYAALGIGWKTAEERWSWAAHRSLAASGAADADGWREVVGLVTVPPEARYLVVMLGTRGQSRDADRAWFDDAQLVKMED